MRLAAIIGTVQSCYTHFPYLRKEWKQNAEEERLLGVSLTGILDNEMMAGVIDKDAMSALHYTGNEDTLLYEVLEQLKQTAIDTNKEWADTLDIPQSVSITTVKPSGTVSQLVDSASGIHPRYAPYYIRTVRADNKDPLTQFLKDQGVPNEPEVFKPQTTTVFSFPTKAPENAVFRDDMTAIDQLNLWLQYQRYWCEHNPSITVYVRDHEWLEVGAWVYKHFDEVSGISFLPHTNHTYQQAPYQEIGKSEYENLMSLMPVNIEWERLSEYELEDNTKSSQTLSCTGDYCEIVDLS